MRLGFGSRDYNLGLEAGGDTDGQTEEKEKIPHVRMHRSLTPSGLLPKKEIRNKTENKKNNPIRIFFFSFSFVPPPSNPSLKAQVPVSRPKSQY